MILHQQRHAMNRVRDSDSHGAREVETLRVHDVWLQRRHTLQDTRRPSPRLVDEMIRDAGALESSPACVPSARRPRPRPPGPPPSRPPAASARREAATLPSRRSTSSVKADLHDAQATRLTQRAHAHAARFRETSSAHEREAALLVVGREPSRIRIELPDARIHDAVALRLQLEADIPCDGCLALERVHDVLELVRLPDANHEMFADVRRRSPRPTRSDTITAPPARQTRDSSVYAASQLPHVTDDETAPHDVERLGRERKRAHIGGREPLLPRCEPEHVERRSTPTAIAASVSRSRRAVPHPTSSNRQSAVAMASVSTTDSRDSSRRLRRVPWSPQPVPLRAEQRAHAPRPFDGADTAGRRPQVSVRLRVVRDALRETCGRREADCGSVIVAARPPSARERSGRAPCPSGGPSRPAPTESGSSARARSRRPSP